MMEEDREEEVVGSRNDRWRDDDGEATTNRVPGRGRAPTQTKKDPDKLLIVMRMTSRDGASRWLDGRFGRTGGEDGDDER